MEMIMTLNISDKKIKNISNNTYYIFYHAEKIDYKSHPLHKKYISSNDRTHFSDHNCIDDYNFLLGINKCSPENYKLEKSCFFNLTLSEITYLKLTLNISDLYSISEDYIKSNALHFSSDKFIDHHNSYV